MLYHGSVAGAFDLRTIVLESLEGMRRAGETIFHVNEYLNNSHHVIWNVISESYVHRWFPSI